MLENNDEKRRGHVPPQEGSETSTTHLPEPLSPHFKADTDQFPEQLPFFRSDLWRLGAALTVLTVLVLACLSGSDSSSVSAESPSSTAQPARQQGFKDSLAVVEPPVAEFASDPVELRIRDLLVQIHAEELATQKIERKLEPLLQEIEARKRSLLAGSQSSNLAFQNELERYQRLLEEQRKVALQWTQNTRACDQLIADHAESQDEPSIKGYQ